MRVNSSFPSEVLKMSMNLYQNFAGPFQQKNLKQRLQVVILIQCKPFHLRPGVCLFTAFNSHFPEQSSPYTLAYATLVVFGCAFPKIYLTIILEQKTKFLSFCATETPQSMLSLK